MPVDRLANAGSAQAVEAVVLDVRGEHMYGVVAVSNQDEEVKDISFIFLVSLQHLSLLVPVNEPLVIVHLPVLVGFFKVSCVCLVFCQIFSLLVE